MCWYNRICFSDVIICSGNFSLDRRKFIFSLQWRHNESDGASNHQRFDCLLNRLFRRRSKKTFKLCATGICEENPLITGEFPSQRASNAKNVFIWWHRNVNQWRRRRTVSSLNVSGLVPTEYSQFVSLVRHHKNTKSKTKHVDQISEDLIIFEV